MANGVQCRTHHAMRLHIPSDTADDESISLRPIALGSPFVVAVRCCGAPSNTANNKDIIQLEVQIPANDYCLPRRRRRSSSWRLASSAKGHIVGRRDSTPSVEHLRSPSPLGMLAECNCPPYGREERTPLGWGNCSSISLDNDASWTDLERAAPAQVSGRHY